MDTVKKVALAGASGKVGSAILRALLHDCTFAITILTRASTIVKAYHPAQLVEVDFDNEDSLRGALKGHDVLISALSKLNSGVEERLIDAAVDAGVKRIIPSGFGCDLENEKCRQFPTYTMKVKIEERLKQLAYESRTTYTFVYNNVLLDWGIESGFLIDAAHHKITLFDGGDSAFSTTRLETVGRAVVGLLHAFEDTSNRAVRVQELVTTQKALLDAAKVTDLGAAWDITTVSTEQLERDAHTKIQNGEPIDLELFYCFAARAAFGYGYAGKFEAHDNDLLGVSEIPLTQMQIFV